MLCYAMLGRFSRVRPCAWPKKNKPGLKSLYIDFSLSYYECV